MEREPGSEPMEYLSRGDCEQLLTLVSGLPLIQDLGSLPSRLLRSLRGIIRHDFGGCHLIEPSRQHIAACYEPESGHRPADRAEFWRLAEQHPLKPVLFAHPSRAWKLSDVISRRDFRATEYYHALCRPLQVECELAALLPENQAPGAYFLISLHRRQPDFSERDRTVLNLLLPHVAAACGRARQGRVAPGGGLAFPPDDRSLFDWLRHRTPWSVTRRESEVLFWLYQGKTNSEIGRILGISERTAETHALRVYPKMGVENRYTAIATLTRLAVSGEVGS